MSTEAQALLNEWSPPFVLDAILLLFVILYLRGWLALHRSSPELFSGRRLSAFLSGMFCLWFAIGSPLSAFDEASLTVHMVQHILLMLVIPPLVLLGAPALPLLHGLPQWFVSRVLGPLLRWPAVQSLGSFLTHPVVCWILAALALIGWHVPSAFELALRSDNWHEVEHACFLSTSLLFWWPVVQPFPSEARWPRWSIPLYLFFGMIPGSALGAFLAFCDRILYRSYAEAPPVFHISPLSDQILAGSLMWVLGTFVCLFPAMFITLKLLSPSLHSMEARPARPPAFRPQEFSSAETPSRL
jgi:putative membrane protein